jgi:hypothetical protein
VAVTVAPATITVMIRAAPGFAETDTRTVASPRPVSGESVAQPTSLLAVHAHAECACTAIGSSPPCDGTVVLPGVTSYRHAAASCATLTSLSLIVMVPSRATGSVFAETR